MPRRKVTLRDVQDKLAEDRSDYWVNPDTGLGDPLKDPSVNTYFTSRAKLSVATLDKLYTQNSVAARIVERPAFDAVRQGWFYSQPGEGDNTIPKAIAKLHKQWGVKRAIFRALKWSRLYGAGLIFIGADDGLDTSEPLGKVREVKYLRVFDRFQTQVAQYNNDPESSRYGQPESYQFVSATTGKTFIAHHTRVLRFDGIDVPERKAIENDSFGWSVFDRVLPEVKAYCSANQYVENILRDFTQDVFQISNLKQLLSGNKSSEVLERFRLIRMAKSIFNAVVIGGEEKYEKRSATVTGVENILREFQFLLGAATGIPLTLLFGRSPAGENSTGESDLTNYYDQIKAYQEDQLEGPLLALGLLALLVMNASATDLDVTFESLWQMSNKERAEVQLKEAQADDLNISNAILIPSEIRNSRFGHRESTITLDDTAYAASVTARATEAVALMEAARSTTNENEDE